MFESQDSSNVTAGNPASSISSLFQSASPLPRALAYLGFVLVGILTTLLGPMLPILSRRLELNDSGAGLFFLAQFVGSTLGALLTTKLSFAAAQKKLFVGYLLLTIGLPGLNGALAVALTGVFCYGLGLGLIIPTTNIAIAEQTPDEKRGSELNLLNFTWVCGAVMCGPLIRWLSVGGDVTRFLYLITSCVGLIAIGFFLASYKSAVRVVTKSAESGENGSQRNLAYSAFWFGLLMLLYVGLENSIAGWAATYSERLGAQETRAILAPSVFWAAILSGRLLGYAWLKRISDRLLFQFAAVLAMVGIAAILQVKESVATLSALALAGFGLAPIFSLIVAFFTRHFREASARFAGGVFAMGGVGGALLPFATGVVSSHFQSLRSGLMLCLAEIICIALVAWRLQKSALHKH